MTPATAEPPDTLADVLKRLGDIPPDRILWTPRPGTAKEKHLLRSRGCELVDGMLVNKALTLWKGLAEVPLGCRMMTHATDRRLGGVTMGSGPYRVAPGVVRCPDVAFIRWDRLFERPGEWPEIAPVAPDLVVEIPTAGNTSAELARKYREFFAAGTQLLWELDPPTRTVTVYTDPVTRTVLTAADTLTGGAALPGFTLPLAELFDDSQFTYAADNFLAPSEFV